MTTFEVVSEGSSLSASFDLCNFSKGIGENLQISEDFLLGVKLSHFIHGRGGGGVLNGMALY
jgi:hypothetical protein